MANGPPEKPVAAATLPTAEERQEPGRTGPDGTKREKGSRGPKLPGGEAKEKVQPSAGARRHLLRSGGPTSERSGIPLGRHTKPHQLCGGAERAQACADLSSASGVRSQPSGEQPEASEGVPGEQSRPRQQPLAF